MNTVTSNAVTIAVDAMGGDFAPYEIVKGAVIAAEQHGVAMLLVGHPEAIQETLQRLEREGLPSRHLPIEIVPAHDVIEMGESPVTALRKKKDASIVVTARCVKEGRAQGMIAAGSTGAAMASAVLHIGRIEGVDRPAIAVVLPSLDKPCLLIDAGANADCIPEMLLQFARMGSIFMKNVYNAEHPTVGLLNIGEELGKGNVFVNSTFKLLEQDPTLNFIGNIEGRDMFWGKADVAVCDGFTGNVALKSAEGVVKLLFHYLQEELTRNLKVKTGAFLAKSAFKRSVKKVDPEAHGGALLLGINGICVIGHGSSSANAVVNAVRVAKEAIVTDVLEKIGSRMAEGMAIG